MKTKHTPGPWHVSGKNGFLNQVGIGPSIGCAYGAGEEIKANARLIAAAPELLEALVSLVATARRYLPDYDENPEIQKADTAIRKATGAGHE